MKFYILYVKNIASEPKENIESFDKNASFLEKSATVMRYVCRCSEISVKLVFNLKIAYIFDFWP